MTDVLLDIQNSASLSPEERSPLAFPKTPTSTYHPERIAAKDVINIAAIYMKSQYGAHHKSKISNIRDFVTLRLHRGFNVTGLAGRNNKVEQQFAGPFRILERIGRLPYRIELPASIR